ncbi:uncharacterized protein BO80DRAFT_179479 [Aspergillus ibericus CBS 121593]|uniref:Uncharacterized protein n=1 Tax=Aspergillus ibericus CBS 121593 TaxID=1448316 RepID=A0A395GQU3_9EURO|nr:hypothetical protein BO80DRAFT_179479 [Aspergillus ibericus CBS 121593]RAK97920.1 hypothetical protein BO80DRAFT_179479 [Aspergillus ibericus CBS 121593]
MTSRPGGTADSEAIAWRMKRAGKRKSKKRRIGKRLGCAMLANERLDGRRSAVDINCSLVTMAPQRGTDAVPDCPSAALGAWRRLLAPHHIMKHHWHVARGSAADRSPTFASARVSCAVQMPDARRARGLDWPIPLGLGTVTAHRRIGMGAQ